jgi:hypothetical protein
MGFGNEKIFSTGGGPRLFYLNFMSRLLPSIAQGVISPRRSPGVTPTSPLKTPRRRLWGAAVGVWALAFFGAGVAANAQFKVVGPAPFPQKVARQKIRTLLDAVEFDNRRQTIDTLNGWVTWYRDLIDEELIAAWQRAPRTDLAEIMGPLADPAVAAGVVDVSWRQERQAAFTLAYARMLGDLMLRFEGSAKPFRDDLLGPSAAGLMLSPSETEAVCRILIDMPDIGTWRKDAVQILPRYRRAAENLLAQDVQSGDGERSYRAQLWQRYLKTNAPDATSGQPGTARRTLTPSASPAPSAPSRSSPAPGRTAPTAPAPVPLTISKGQSVEEVIKILGQPLTIADLGGKKTIYIYKDLKVTFKNEKVTEAQ